MLFNEEDTESLRNRCRDHKTTIAAAVIVAALAAVRKVFTPRAERKQKKLPNYQSWVVTSSTRHLLPNSRLLEGADKETDPSIMEFGGYGGSISHERFSFKESSDMWDRCRATKSHLSSSFLKSMRRMKLMNYAFRKPKLWEKLQAKVDLEEITRTYSVEVANLGAWSTPYAPKDAGRTDLGTPDWFAGTLNNSFLGARALFTIALISVNNVMSFTIAYDIGTITDQEGVFFVNALRNALDHLKSSTTDKLLVKDLDSS